MLIVFVWVCMWNTFSGVRIHYLSSCPIFCICSQRCFVLALFSCMIVVFFWGSSSFIIMIKSFSLSSLHISFFGTLYCLLVSLLSFVRRLSRDHIILCQAPFVIGFGSLAYSDPCSLCRLLVFSYTPSLEIHSFWDSLLFGCLCLWVSFVYSL